MATFECGLGKSGGAIAPRCIKEAAAPRYSNVANSATFECGAGAGVIIVMAFMVVEVMIMMKMMTLVMVMMMWGCDPALLKRRRCGDV